MAIRQLSVFVENRPGTLADVTDAIADAQIDIRAMSMAETQQFGLIRMIVDDVETAKQKLSDRNLFVKTTEVVGIAVNDEPGGLAKAVRIIGDAGINIDYLYAFISVSKKNAYVVIRVDDNSAAEKLLAENGIELVAQEDISKL